MNGTTKEALTDIQFTRETVNELGKVSFAETMKDMDGLLAMISEKKRMKREQKNGIIESTPPVVIQPVLEPIVVDDPVFAPVVESESEATLEPVVESQVDDSNPLDEDLIIEKQIVVVETEEPKVEKDLPGETDE